MNGILGLSNLTHYSTLPIFHHSNDRVKDFMIGTLIKKIVGSKNERELKRIRPMIQRINALEPQVRPLTDDQLRAKTSELKERIDRGESLEEILPEAFAVVREAARRTLGERHYDVQLSSSEGLSFTKARFPKWRLEKVKPWCPPFLLI